MSLPQELEAIAEYIRDIANDARKDGAHVDNNRVEQAIQREQQRLIKRKAHELERVY